VILYGLTVGYTLWYKWFESPAHRYPLDFKVALWISTGQDTPHGYFVKEIFIPEKVADAWIHIAAPDNVTLLVNNISIGTDNFISLNVSNIHDVTTKIQYGKNVIAAHVSRSSYPGGARLLLKGTYTDLNGREHLFVSDGTWKVSSVEERQGQGNTLWSSTDFDHSGWKQAKIEGGASAFSVYPSTLSPHLLGKALSGYWIWHPEPGVKSAYFQKSFRIHSLPKDGIIGIAGSSHYGVIINGVTIAKDIFFNNEFHLYDITPLLHPGENLIGIGVKAPDTTPGLFIDGYIREGDSNITLKGDATWRTISNISIKNKIPDIHSTEWKVPLLLGKYPYQPWGVLPKIIKEIEYPVTFTLMRSIKFTLLMLLTISGGICFWLLAGSVYAKIKRGDFTTCLLLDGFFHLPPFLFMFFIFLLQFEVRCDSSFPFHYQYIFLSLIFLCLFRIGELIHLLFFKGKRMVDIE